MGTISKHVEKNGGATCRGKVRRKRRESKQDRRGEEGLRDVDTGGGGRAGSRRGNTTQTKAGKPHAGGLNTLADVLRRYRDKVRPADRGGDIEVRGINHWLRECREFVATPAAQQDASKVTAWRDS
jgi:hypothetical protein